MTSHRFPQPEFIIHRGHRPLFRFIRNPHWRATPPDPKGRAAEYARAIEKYNREQKLRRYSRQLTTDLRAHGLV